MFAKYPELFFVEQLQDVSAAIAKAVEATMAAAQVSISRDNLKDRVERCCAILLILRGDLHWSMSRCLDHLSDCLIADLAGLPLPISEDRKSWVEKIAAD